jgi:hypothetical protein
LIVVVDVVDVVVVVLLEFICLIALEKVKRSHINHCDLMVENTCSVVQQRRNSTFRFLKVENSLLLLSLAISQYRQYLLMLQTLKLNNEKLKKSSFYEEKV